jgi:hypothetical protein
MTFPITRDNVAAAASDNRAPSPDAPLDQLLAQAGAGRANPTPQKPATDPKAIDQMVSRQARGKGKSATPDKAAMPPSAFPTLAQAEKRVAEYAKQYQQKADGKAGVQQFGDWLRKPFNRGESGQHYGDDQQKNIGETAHQLSMLRAKVGKTMTQAQADTAAAVVLKKFNAEEARVTRAQGANAEIGKGLHAGGRVVVVGGTGVLATVYSGGNLFAGAGAANLAGNLYDGISALDQGKSAIAPKLDAGQSLGGVAVRSLKGEAVNGGDWARGGLGSFTDSVNGGFAGRGTLVAKAAQRSAQLTASQTNTTVGRWALGKAAATASTANTTAQTLVTTSIKNVGTWNDRSLTREQRNAAIQQNSVQAGKQLLVGVPLGFGSSHLGVSAQIKNKFVDAGAQFLNGATTHVVQTSLTNGLNGKGLGLDAADWGSAVANSGGGALQNKMQRVPRRSAQEVVNEVGSMHPYVGVALTTIPDHAQGRTAVVGEPTSAQGPSNRSPDVQLAGHTSTPALWKGGALGRANNASGPAPQHLYRTFVNPLTGKRVALKVDLGRPHVMGQQDQSAMNKATKQAGLSITIPLRHLIDETPSNVLPRTPGDTETLLLLRAATRLGKLAGGVARAISPNPLPRWQSEFPDDTVGGRLKNVGSPAQNKVRQAHAEGLALGSPSEWLGHFLKGTGTPKIMTAAQVDRAMLGDCLPELFEPAAASEALGAQMKAMKANNQSRGNVEGFTQKDVVRFTSTAHGWHNTVGSAHFIAAFKGKWTTNSSDGSMRFTGERRIVLQDRYNWEAPEFNGADTAPHAPIPAAVVRSLPASHQSAFNPVPGNKKFYGVTDGLLAHLQMVKGGAQPFWTVGVGSPTPVDYTVNAQGEWSVTK